VPVALSKTTITFSSTVYTATSVVVRDMREQIDVTSLSDGQRQYQVSPLFNAAEAQVEFVGYGPRAGASGVLTAPGVSGIGGTVVSSSTTFSLNDLIRSQATIQFTRSSP
jgi:hypothetical protein